MTETITVTSTSCPIVRKPRTNLQPYSFIRDGGSVRVGGKLYYWDAVRLFDRKAPQGQRVEWAVELSIPGGPRLRASCLLEVRKAVLDHFKGRIEADNAARDAAYWAERAGVAGGETDDTVAADVAQAELDAAEAPKVRREGFLSIPPAILALTDDLAEHIARHSIAKLGPEEAVRRLKAGEAVVTHGHRYSLAGEA